MIDALAGIDLSRAEQAFAQAWRDTPRRQRYLVETSRRLGVSALEAMLSCLPLKEGDQDSEIAFRAMCIEIRRRHMEALPIILRRYAIAAKPDRKLLVKVIAWLPEAEPELQIIIAGDPDPDIREMAEKLLLLHRRRAAAVPWDAQISRY